jgi:eukaryotic-like serine/threonine-protein kinase
VLDFGLATEIGGWTSSASYPDEQVGTACYMSPEQALGDPPAPANDWYSVGVMLYEALVGSPPFVGSRFNVIEEKIKVDAPRASTRAAGVPQDLDALCAALLQRDPGLRPSGADVLRRLESGGNARSSTTASSIASDRSGTSALLGRERELGALRAAFDRVQAGQSITVLIGGAPGMGKSSVARRFVDELGEGGEAVVLRGRAYERESVPYKAFDQVIDAVSLHLLYLDECGEPLALPRDMGLLAHLFPVLSRVPGVADSVGEKAIGDPQAVRMRAFAALRELLASLAQRQPVVVYIDDAQWGDADSVALLLEIIRPPTAPPILFLLTSREEEAATSQFLLAMNEQWPQAAEKRGLTVGPLEIEDAERLALSLIDSTDELAQQVARVAARESKGSPFLVEELVRSNQSLSRATDSALSVYTLGQAVAKRLERLPEAGRRLAEFVAVAGRPLALPTLLEACGEAIRVDEQLDQLVSERLVRVGFRDGLEVLEPSHDRIRETIAEQQRDRHGRLARALETTPGADLEAIALHFLASGDEARDKTAKYAERAAESAMGKLAFAQATRMFELAIDKTSVSVEETRRLRSRLALVLEWSGRGEEAAHAYLRAAEGAPPLQRAQLERAASIELLSCGRLIEGEQVLHRVLSAVGLEAPSSSAAALFFLLWYRQQVKVWAFLGLPMTERRGEDIAPLARARIDALFSASIGFAYTDVILGNCMGTRSLLMALRKGDRVQVMRSALLEASQHAGLGGKQGKLERELVDFAERFVQSTGSPPAMGFFQGSRGVATYLRGEWKKAFEMLDSATSRTQIHDHRAGWVTSAKVFACWSLNFLGEHRELARRHAALLADAEQRGDRFTSVQLLDGSLAILWLVDDDPQGGRRNAKEAIALWPQDRYLLQHWHMLYGEGEIELYLGDGAQGYARVQRDDRALKKSFLLNVQHVRVQTAFLRGRCAIASLDAQPFRRAKRLAEVRRLAHRLNKEGMTWSAPFAAILTAAAADAEGNDAAAIAALRRAIELAQLADMHGYVHAARYQLGSVLGGDEGSTLKAAAEERMTAQGIRVPSRFAATLVPGRWGTR